MFIEQILSSHRGGNEGKEKFFKWADMTTIHCCYYRHCYLLPPALTIQFDPEKELPVPIMVNSVRERGRLNSQLLLTHSSLSGYILGQSDYTDLFGHQKRESLEGERFKGKWRREGRFLVPAVCSSLPNVFSDLTQTMLNVSFCLKNCLNY